MAWRRRFPRKISRIELLNLAEDEFDALLTIDTNLRYQQNLIGRKIAIVLLRATSNRLAHLKSHFNARAQVLSTIKPGDFVELGAG